MLYFNIGSISSTSKATYHHTPNQASSTNFSNSNYSLPMGTIMDSPSNTFQSSLSPRHSQNNFSEKNRKYMYLQATECFLFSSFVSCK